MAAGAGAGAPARPLAQAADWLLSLVGITASDSDEHLIKRIIGVGGDHVVCCNAIGQVTVNGTPIDETPT
jgi:signal peptidase I